MSKILNSDNSGRNTLAPADDVPDARGNREGIRRKDRDRQRETKSHGRSHAISRPTEGQLILDLLAHKVLQISNDGRSYSLSIQFLQSVIDSAEFLQEGTDNFPILPLAINLAMNRFYRGRYRKWMMHALLLVKKMIIEDLDLIRGTAVTSPNS